MAIDLGDLKQYNAEQGLKFEWAGRSYHVQADVEHGLGFHATHHEMDTKREELREKIRSTDAEESKAAADKLRSLNRFGTFELMAPMFGSTFHYPTKTKGARFTGGILAELQENGMDWGTLERIVTTLYLMMVNSEAVAQEYMKTGKLEQAVAVVAAREKSETDALATQQAPGATSGND
ncbi:DUF7426 family protein [Corynebacterium ureicelerivorans]|uniref:DUF7426 domain-containing protein n=1 Tax=Corynebacterium ureicelerivorans TaxID=401472 RepID=A0A077HN67_9CORY|nr:hypothetical protein [Corynebacterium ureicelerivorans]AIL96431.1 hypothetical protein CUREI_03185 [Corynebacterium ureicelerivorans]AIL97836.1 hypothetical protein CUREI_11715 [Corynebacterium ureicelerivorans]